MRFNIKYFPNFLGQCKSNMTTFNSYFLKDLSMYNVEIIKHSNKSLNNNLKILKHNLDNDVSKRKVVIGGDHSNSISTLAHTAGKYNDLKVLWVDAHGDINTYAKSSTKNVHGMVLSFLTNEDKMYNDMITRHIKPQDIMYIGLRDLDEYEKNVIRDNNIKCISCDDINNDMIGVYNKVNDFVGNSHIHLSFDVDSLDPIYMPSTGTSVKNGIDIDVLYDMFELLLKNDKLVHIDIMELNLSLGDSRDKMLSMMNVMRLLNMIKKQK